MMETVCSTDMNIYYPYLEELRMSGTTNMWNAEECLINDFPALSKNQAGEVLLEWMKIKMEECYYEQ